MVHKTDSDKNDTNKDTNVNVDANTVITKDNVSEYDKPTSIGIGNIETTCFMNSIFL